MHGESYDYTRYRPRYPREHAVGGGSRRKPGRTDRRRLDHPQPRERWQSQVVGRGLCRRVPSQVPVQLLEFERPELRLLDWREADPPFRELAQARLRLTR